MLRNVLPVVLLVVLPLLPGCQTRSPPVLGDWRGTQRALGYDFPRTVELILDGREGTGSGTYRLASSSNEPRSGDRLDDVRWSDRWQTRTVTGISGQRYRLLHLSDVPGTLPTDYLWTANDVLVPVIDPTHPDLSTQALTNALYPRPRGAFGYGRL